jgi:adenylate kinase
MCATREPEQHPQLVLVFGGPGAGKGTQASLLAKALSVPHISSGELLREQSRGSQVMNRGDLLPDDVVTTIVTERLAQPDAQRGAVLDGFPRTLAQARALDAWLAQHGGAVRAAFYLDVPRDELVARLVRRGRISQRGDDRADVADNRVAVFLRELPPVVEHYATQGVLHRVDGAQSVEDVQRQIIDALQ